MLVGNRFRQSLLTHTRLWYLINAKDQINGRLAAYIATILQGKTKPIWHPKADVGDFLVVVNTKDIAFSGRKWDRKVYRHHTGIASSVECCFCPYGATLYIQHNKTTVQVTFTLHHGITMLHCASPPPPPPPFSLLSQGQNQWFNGERDSSVKNIVFSLMS